MDDIWTTDDMHTAIRLLSRLGITANYDGFLYTAHAVSIAAAEPGRLQSVTNFLYPEVAAIYNTSSDNVRKNISKVRDIAWETDPGLLCEIGSYQLKKKPGTAQFLALLTVYVICQTKSRRET